MRWYTGGIAEAITISKAKGALFVVYVEGKDDQSKKFTNLIDNHEVSKKLESQQFVAIKIEAGSVPHQQFSEIYKDTPVPSLYFIGKNGSPLCIITEAEDSEILAMRIDSITAGINGAEPEIVATDHPNTTATTSSVAEDASLTAEEKVDRAKELLQKKKEEKEKQEKEKEYQKEIERRKMGQSVQQLKKWQEDQELKQIMEEREREKRENQLARDRVLAQIAQDRAERQAKFTQPKPATSETNRPQASSPPKSNMFKTRLQFKLPDGTSGMQEFANSDTLETVVAHIRDNMNLPFSDFRLSTTFPRREFTVNDYSQSLLDLELTPTAVILVLPVSRGTVSTSQGGTFTTLIWSLFTPIFQIFGYLKTFIFGTNRNVEKKKSTEESTSRPEQSRMRPRDSTVIKRQGNVHRLSDRTDSDDDGNTWNGNSTQQM